MNKRDKHVVARSANAILWLWADLLKRSQGDSWFEHHGQRAYQDAMQAMVSCGLIEDYDVVKIAVKIKDEWRTDRLGVVI